MNQSYKVYDVMTSNPIVISKNKTIREAALMMKENRVASLVVKENNKFIGLLTERDIARKAVAEDLDTSSIAVSRIMSGAAHTIHPTEDIRDAVKKIACVNQKQLPVVDGEKLMGLLTFKDIMRVQPHLFGLVYEKYRIREEDRKPVFVSRENEGTCAVCGNYTFNLMENDESDSLCADCQSIL